MILFVIFTTSNIQVNAQNTDLPNRIDPTSGSYGFVTANIEQLITTPSGVEGELVITNHMPMWFALSVQTSDTSISVSPRSTMALINVLSPEGTTRYKGIFASVGQKVIITARYDGRAAALNIGDSLSKILTIGLSPTAEQLATLVDDLSKIDTIEGAARELYAIKADGIGSAPGHIFEAGKALSSMVDDTDKINLIVSLAKKAGITITKEKAKNLLTPISIYQELVHISGLITSAIISDYDTASFEASLSTPNVGDITGRVSAAGGIIGLSNVSVIVSNGRTTMTTKTDTLGRYNFYRFPATEATISATNKQASASVPITVVGGITNQPADLILINLTIALVIDSSGSMAWNDPNGLRKAAAKVLVQALTPTDRLTVIDFDDYARTIWPLSAVGNSKSAIENTIDYYINAQGGTNISDGLRVAYGQINVDGKADPETTFTILLTDGQQDPPSSYNIVWEDAFAKAGLPVYTFGLSESADKITLARIATKTKAEFTQLTDATLTTSLYNKLRAKISQNMLITDQAVRLQQGETLTQTMSIPQFTRTVTIVTAWPGSNVETTLRTPIGTPLSTTGLMRGITHIKTGTYEIYQIEYPLPGLWMIEAYGAALNPGGELVSVQADVDVPITTVQLPFVVAVAP